MHTYMHICAERGFTVGVVTVVAGPAFGQRAVVVERVYAYTCIYIYMFI